jgi:magnesium chelatase family protein
VLRYLAKLSGPLLDRIDMHVEVPALPPEVMTQASAVPAESSATVRERVAAARARQAARQQKCNAELVAGDMDRYCQPVPEAARLLTQVMDKYHFSARVYHRILKVARTIADLNQHNLIETSDLSEALACRCLDRAKRQYAG